MKNKRKKIDSEALTSSFMNIRNMSVKCARGFLDIKIKYIHELIGRTPEVLFNEIKNKNSQIEEDILPYIKMAVYYAENENDLDYNLLHPSQWL